jgi:putative ABC transport system permease protein
LALFIAEGLLLGLVGAAIGIAISLGAVALLNAYPLKFPFGREVITLLPSLAVRDVLLAGVLVVVMAVLASLQPAWKASRMEPVTALRHV